MMPPRKDWNQDRQNILSTYTSWLQDTKGLMADHTLARELEDDRPLALRRKRRNSSSVFAEVNRGGQESSTVNNPANSTSATTVRTPKKPKKRVRFSDPGPSSNANNSTTTGLTPAIARTSLRTSSSSSAPSRQQTPFRRHSTSAVPPTEIVQFTPLTQQLTPRIKRRMRRNRLSEEMNYIEKDRNEAAASKREETNALKKQLEAKEEEIARLKEEVAAVMDPKSSGGSKLVELEEEHSLLRDRLESSFGGECSLQDDIVMTTNDDDFEIIDHPMNDSASCALASSPTRKQKPRVTDASTEASLTSWTHEAEIFAISLEYENQIDSAKKEKRELFNRLRPHFPPSQFGLGSRESTPTPESLDRLADTLLTTKARADDADDALSALWTELKAFGFPGDRMEEIVNEMKQQFRQARLELERAIPGETVTGFEPAKVIPTFIQHIQGLAVELHSRESEVRGMNDRHSALSGQFDITLGRLDNAARRIVELEQTIDSGAEEMLTIRMTAQRLEKEIAEKDVGISRLIDASDKYRDDIKSLETLVKKLESDDAQQQKQLTSRVDEAVGDLECKIAAEEKGRRSAEACSSQRGLQIKELEKSVEEGKSYATEVEAHLEALKFEKEQVASSMQARLNLQEEKHESHLGALNVRISNLTTALASANAEVDKLKVIKDKLEKRIREEVDDAQLAMEMMQERAIRSVTRNNETKKSYLRKSKIRYANDEIDEDEVLEQRGPLTPDSAVRFKDYVEVGRGKHRRKYDSGIGILSEEEEGEDELATEPLSEGDSVPGDMIGMEVGEPSSTATC